MYLKIELKPLMDSRLNFGFGFPPGFSLLRHRLLSFPVTSLVPLKLSPPPFGEGIAAKRRFPGARRGPIEGVSDELNLIASQSLDQALARRRVRSAFVDVQQRLDHCLFTRAPTGIRTEEWYERNSEGMDIFCKSWLPEPDIRIKALVFFCHGYGSTCTFFFDGIAKQIAGSGYGVFAIDHPGFGLSDGLHGYISSFDKLVENAIEQYTKIKGRPEFRGLPRFLLGQSMGGAIALKVHLKESQAWNGLILVAPMCKIAEDVKPPPLLLKALILMSTLFPKAKLFPKQDLDDLFFRDPMKRKTSGYNVISYDDRTRLRTAVELLNATRDIEMQADQVSLPLLILHGAADKVTSPSASKFLYEKATSKDKTLKLYDGGFHCIMEGEYDDRIFAVISDIIDWLDAHSSAKRI
ncbi:PREDICTED: caffeoylshikimate esterase-like [Tarenaya hassleriana]|uniref:caffeoylshikimate esterase-like n=1 Tax=Tarenaya hassleriana TaxID=28532 RepID=UPI00053C274D|nr:PREDICTED: caffeoylshikimate esterase-like [Tarenaya hassleriana]